jgi:hypothetical protein
VRPRNLVGVVLLALSLTAFDGGGCAPTSDSGSTSGSGGGGSTQYCNTGYCYSYLEQVCCPRSAPYACNAQCWNYSGGGGCTSYKTTCY